jgi:proteasome lid subunit RPN8/RPN11
MIAPGSQNRPRVAISEAVVVQTEVLLRVSRWRPHERIVYWAGFEMRTSCLVTTVIRPNAVMTGGSFRTTSQENAQAVAFMRSHNLVLIGQVHTHPSSYIDHSEGDDEDAFMRFENYLSLVVPFYARRGVLPLTACGIHRFEGNFFRRLTTREIENTFTVVPTSKDFE